MDDISVKCVTWNVETTWPEEELLPLFDFNTEQSPPDILIICLQEVKSQPQNVLMDSLFEEPWTTSFRKALGSMGYVRITGERLQGILTSVFVKRHHLPHLRDIHTSFIRTGLGGLWGNKGAVGVRFTLYGCSVCIVNSHLAAHDSGYDERCSNYNAIIDQTLFPVVQTSRILYHDYVFWMGDLNFRLMGDEGAEDIIKIIQNNDLEYLLNKDELMKAQSAGDAFGPLTEGKINFPPTYKYYINSKTYDLSRRPAWTDRILHQVHVDAYENVKLGVRQLFYQAKSEFGQSDHKPVVSGYVIKTFANYVDRCVHFKPIRGWLIGEAHKIRYSIDADVFTDPWDYIAMFKTNFTSVDQYVTYTYVPQRNQELDATCSSDYKRNDEVYELEFNDELVQATGLYVMLYYSAKYHSFLGMSEYFAVTEKF